MKELSSLNDQFEYESIDQRIFEAILNGDTNTAKDLITKYEIRRVPYAEGVNHGSNYYQLNNIPGYYWTAIPHMIRERRVDEQKMIETIRFFINNGFSIY